MRIIADENIPFAREALAPAGEVRFRAGRTIAREDLMQCDALVVRSITRVTAEMLEGTPVRFVGTATAGTDHLDLAGLAKAGIVTASAGGSNAESVAQHVAAVLCELHRLDGVALEGRRIGIVGVGQCGSRVARVARALGMIPMLCDPPLAEVDGGGDFVPLDEITNCDVVTFHTPLTRSGEHATHHLVGADFLSRAKPGMILIQASRGGVVVESALKEGLARGVVAAAALDVWENEPNPSPEMVARARIATPHIAGHSFDGKLLGTEMMHAALCRFAGLAPTWRASEQVPRPERALEVSLEGRRPLDVVADLVLQVRPVMEDDSAMRRLGALPPPVRSAAFDELWRNYPQRREFAAWRVHVTGGAPETRERCMEILRGLGFSDIKFD